MKDYEMYSIFDRLAGTFAAPFVEINAYTAVRRFNYLISANKLADVADFDLYRVGSFFSETGHIVAQPLEFIVRGGQEYNFEEVSK